MCSTSYEKRKSRFSEDSCIHRVESGDVQAAPAGIQNAFYTVLIGEKMPATDSGSSVQAKTECRSVILLCPNFKKTEEHQAQSEQKKSPFHLKANLDHCLFIV
jgi:hypothetical protein